MKPANSAMITGGQGPKGGACVQNDVVSASRLPAWADLGAAA